MIKKRADYFTHDFNAQDDPKCIKLINEKGMAGYGIFWALLEKLRASRDRRLRFDDLEGFAIRWNTTVYEIENVLKGYKLFVFDDEFFYSPRLTDDLNAKSELARKSVSYRWNPDPKNTNEYERIQTNTPNQTKPIKNGSAYAGKKDRPGGKKMVY